VRGRASQARRLLLGVAAVALLLGPTASAGASTSQQTTWSYDPGTHRLVSPAGELPFAVQGGTAVTAAGAPAVKFTKAPSLATWTGTGFPTPGTQDFTWTAVMSMDLLKARATPNVAQHGLYNGHQVKLQLNRKGVAQCVLNGTNGRRILTSSHPTLNDGGAQHSFSCWRRGSTLGVTVDAVTDSLVFDIGAINPTGQPTLGNRTSTGGAKDQLFGKLWSLTVTIGGA
jgi:hypothetical protein